MNGHSSATPHASHCAPFLDYGQNIRHVTPAQDGVQKSWIQANAGMTIKAADEGA
jgi:hypothetical protein